MLFGDFPNSFQWPLGTHISYLYFKYSYRARIMRAAFRFLRLQNPELDCAPPKQVYALLIAGVALY